MKWIVKLPSGSEYKALGGNPEDAAKFVDHALERPQPGQQVELEVRRESVHAEDKQVYKVTLHGECVWTAYPRRV